MLIVDSDMMADAQPRSASAFTGPNKADSLLAIALVPVQLRIVAGRVQVSYRLALDNCADWPIVSIRAHVELVAIAGETDPDRLAQILPGSMGETMAIRLARLDPGETHQETGTLVTDLTVDEGPAAALFRLRILAANLAPITSAWVIGKARHQPGARVAALEPVDIGRGPAVHELLLARQLD